MWKRVTVTNLQMGFGCGHLMWSNIRDLALSWGHKWDFWDRSKHSSLGILAIPESHSWREIQGVYLQTGLAPAWCQLFTWWLCNKHQLYWVLERTLLSTGTYSAGNIAADCLQEGSWHSSFWSGKSIFYCCEEGYFCCHSSVSPSQWYHVLCRILLFQVL